jgi:hypothetical protein
MILTAVSKPPFAPSTNASKMFVFLYTAPSTIKKRMRSKMPLPNTPENIWTLLVSKVEI